jgi:hypothetical protein
MKPGSRAKPACLAIAALLAGGCATGGSDPYFWDTGIVDTHGDTGLPDTAPDTSLPDTGWDTGLDTPPDTAGDIYVDTAPDTTCTETPCGLVPNCGCPSGQKCSLVGSVRQCVDAGTGVKGSPCTDDTQCAAGFLCVGLFTTEGATERACYPFCLDESHCSGDASICFEAFTGVTDRICSLGCNLLTGSGCPSGSKCTLLTLTTTGQNFTDCTADAGSGYMGSICTLESQCGAGTFCGHESGVDECIGYCSITPSDSCTCGMCQQFTDSVGTPVTIIFDGISYGYCYC